MLFDIYRMDLHFEREEAIIESMFATLVDTEDEDNSVFTVQGIDAYGNVFI